MRVRLGGLAAAAVLVASLCATSAGAVATHGASGHDAVGTHASAPRYPIGVRDPHEPSGEAPPTAAAMPGYTRSYVTDFTGSTLPTGWGAFSGAPSGDAGSYWAPDHVFVSGGMLRLLTYRDPRHGEMWVSGGACYCEDGHAYGAYFVRSRVTGPGPDEDELLWPVAHVWPPEVDFNETGDANASSWSVHYGTGQAFLQGRHAFNLTRWHTWGVIWTPTSLTFTIDGVVWGQLHQKVVVPHRAMTLDIDQEARCIPQKWAACPTREVALQVDWVAEYTPVPK